MTVQELSEFLKVCDPKTTVCIMDDSNGPFVLALSVGQYSTNVLGGKVVILKTFLDEILSGKVVS